MTAEVKKIALEKDDETTAIQLKCTCILSEQGYEISLATILQCRLSLGWTFRGSVYCQLIRERNKIKRAAWARTYLDESKVRC